MLENVQLPNTLFIDLETVSAKPEYAALSERMQTHWQKKSRFLLRAAPGEVLSPEAVAAAYHDKAAIFAEFGKIVCISIGYIRMPSRDLRIKSFAGLDERTLLLEFVELINRHYHDPARSAICGHNIREFDIPYLCRRLMINQIELPSVFRLAGKKPWETAHLLDTMTLWKFGDLKNFTSLDLLASVLGIETPKDDIDGSMVGDVFWRDQDLPRIVTYCEKDVVTVAQVLLRMKGMPLLEADHIISV